MMNTGSAGKEEETRPDAPTPAGGVTSARASGMEAIAAPILIVDDHPANLLALRGILEPLGQPVVEATSGEEALRRLLKEEYAVILMDVQMPGLDGFRTATIIKERPRTRHIPIIFLTALSRDAAHVFKGYAHGAVDYLLKPFDPEILRSKVTVFVDLFRKGEQIKRQEAMLREKELGDLERRSERRYRGVIDSMPHCVWVLRPDGGVDYANEAARQLDEESARVGIPVHPDERGTLDEAWKSAARGARLFEGQYRLRSRVGGTYRWYLLSGVPELDEGGQVVGWIVTATDFDDRKQAEEALRAANEAKDSFLAAASHELRTPLQAAKGHAHLALMRLGEQTDQPGPGKALRIIMKQIDRMAKLVEDLLDVSRLQAGRLALELEQFDLGQLLHEVAERTQPLSQNHPIQVKVPDSLAVEGDRSRIEQVVVNLLSNAVRYSPDGGAVKVLAELEGDNVHLSVSDSGVGIPKEKQELIFERFGRAHGSRYGGLGLGLTISHGIVAQHGGQMWVESPGEAGKGSAFHVRIPRHHARS